ncbi:MAG: transcription elongation factor GreB [Legionella sp.]|nr:transcription elongation factor GreB [Legionella sp.]
MSKAFTKETDTDEEELPDEADTLPLGVKNYVTPRGLKLLDDELHQLLRVERPKVVDVVSWAAGNGDRSENGDYIYGKRRLREIDRRVRYLTKRRENAELVDPTRQKHMEQVFFGATITYATSKGEQRTVKIVGIDEAAGTDDGSLISWVAPIARALTKAREGDIVKLRTPGGEEALEVLEISYGP